jgi:hypothetical protein
MIGRMIADVLDEHNASMLCSEYGRTFCLILGILHRWKNLVPPAAAYPE